MTTRNDKVIRRFLDDRNPIKSSSMSISDDGNLLYSYKTVIAKKVHAPGYKTVIQVARKNWSITTKIHIGLLLRAATNTLMVRVPDPVATPDENLITLRQELLDLAVKSKRRVTNTIMWEFEAAKEAFDELHNLFWIEPVNGINTDFTEARGAQVARRRRMKEMYIPNLERDLRRWIKSKVLYPKTRYGFRDYPEEIRLESVVPLVIRTSHGSRFTAEDILDHKTAHFTDAQQEMINDTVQNYVSPA